LKMKLAVVGATGLVGREILKVLEEMDFAVSRLIPVASPRSVGTMVRFNGQEIRVVSHEEAIAARPEVAVFSAGASTSKEWAPKYASAGIYVIDNSSAWRMFPEIPLVVPEINSGAISKDQKIIANPNCSTIQLVLVLAPLHDYYKIRRVVVSTYQSVTGTGKKAVQQLENERNGIQGEMAYPYPIDLNLIPHGGEFLENGYTSEEVKLVNETRKILGDPLIRLTGTVVRVPVYGGHSESVNIEFESDFDLKDIRNILEKAPGIIVLDDPSQKKYPTPLIAQGKNEVFVGRIRRDESQPNSLNLWIVADNLRKGAATNAIQIAIFLQKAGLV
jgi:aspartate-semialdehyde dehydrogenase